MPTLVGWTLIVVLQVPNTPSVLQGVGVPENNLTLEQCIKKASAIMSNFKTPHLAMCAPIYRQLNGDPT